MPERTRCPICGEGTLRPIIYGLVAGGELDEKARQGEIVLGGCSVGEESPKGECSNCGERLTESERREVWPERP